MAAKDIIHGAVKRALEKDDWDVNFDPYVIDLGNGKKLKPDLGAERVIMASNDLEQIVIEIKTFGLPSILNSFHEAFGQYLNYRDALAYANIERGMYIALSEELYYELIDIAFIKKQFAKYHFKIIVVDIETETIVLWIN